MKVAAAAIDLRDDGNTIYRTGKPSNYAGSFPEGLP
jgi:hypothetical protein